MKDKLNALKELSDAVSGASSQAGTVIAQAVQMYRSPLAEKCVDPAKLAKEVQGEVCSFCEEMSAKVNELLQAAKGLS